MAVLVEFIYICGFPYTTVASVLNRVDVGALRRPFTKLNVKRALSIPNPFWCVFGVIVMLEHPIASQDQASRRRCEMKLMNLEEEFGPPFFYSPFLYNVPVSLAANHKPHLIP